MKKGFKVLLVILLTLATLALCIFYVMRQDIAVIHSQGVIGEQESHLITTASLLMLIVVIPVFILTIAFAWRYRESNTQAKHTPDWEHNYIAEYCWWGVPFVIIVVLGVLAWTSSHKLNPFKPIESEKPAITIQVVALQWKWLFIYPEQKIATVNYIEFPEKTPIRFEITADAPMNSFWIPKLGGQIYAMPAMRSILYLMAKETGSFRGVSANISGKGFAGMTFTAKAVSEEEFKTWVASVKRSSQVLNQEEYEKLLIPSEYDPASLYVLEKEDLFNEIIMKYMEPAK